MVYVGQPAELFPPWAASISGPASVRKVSRWRVRRILELFLMASLFSRSATCPNTAGHRSWGSSGSAAAGSRRCEPDYNHGFPAVRREPPRSRGRRGCAGFHGGASDAAKNSFSWHSFFLRDSNSTGLRGRRRDAVDVAGAATAHPAGVAQAVGQRVRPTRSGREIVRVEGPQGLTVEGQADLRILSHI